MDAPDSSTNFHWIQLLTPTTGKEDGWVARGYQRDTSDPSLRHTFILNLKVFKYAQRHHSPHTMKIIKDLSYYFKIRKDIGLLRVI